MKSKAPFIAKILDELFPDPEIPLKHSNPFTFLVAVMLSAQCTDKKVNEVTPHLFCEGDCPKYILSLGQERVESILKPLGLYKTKAANLLKLSQVLIEKFNAQVPDNFEDLESLPGIGHKTASCVMSQAFFMPAFAVDTHIHRLAKRWKLSKARTVEETEKDLKRLFAKSEWSKRHLQIIYYARAFCPAKGHDEKKCPICFSLNLRRS